MNAFFHDLFRILGIFIPLIVTNCAIIGRAEAFASRNDPLVSLVDGFATGLGFCITLVLLGGLRELTGRGSLFSGAELLLGDWGRHLVLTIIPEHPGFLLAILPPGAFFGLALLIASRNAWQARQTRKTEISTQPIANMYET
jgi:electron transport complex protein RnfE